MRDRLIKTWRIIAGWGLIAAGVVLLGLGWVGVSGNPDIARQLSYLVSGGIGGLLLGIIGVGLLVSQDLRADRDRLGRVEAAMLEVREVVVAQSASQSNGAPQKAVRTKKLDA
ncbi:MAG: hypothetical protein ABR548_11620 [Actinomycetota bacterium]|nr:hypothetical protein [Actinomycetota bacterium]